MRDYEVQKRLILYGNIVINVGGYIGSSTRSEIEYAKSTGKAVREAIGAVAQRHQK